MYKNYSTWFIDEPLLEIGIGLSIGIHEAKKGQNMVRHRCSRLKFIFYVIRCLILIIFMHRFILDNSLTKQHTC